MDLVKQLFIDGSVHPQTKVGFGAYLIYDKDASTQTLFHKRFENTSSTKQEIEAFLWAFENEALKNQTIEVYTDCQNLLSLLNRREKLETNDYLTSTGKEVKNRHLYQKFYTIIDAYDCTIIKVKGHKKTSLKDATDEVFTLVDKHARTLLRAYLKTL